MKCGDVVFTKSLNAYFENKTVHGHTSYKAPKDHYFVLLHVARNNPEGLEPNILQTYEAMSNRLIEF